MNLDKLHVKVHFKDNQSVAGTGCKELTAEFYCIY